MQRYYIRDTQLTDQGVREINLLGQNVNAYRSASYNGGICTFAELLRLVAPSTESTVSGYITSHPIEFTDDIIDVYYYTPSMVSFVYLQVQSSSDRILTMDRTRPYPRWNINQSSAGGAWRARMDIQIKLRLHHRLPG